MNKQSVRNAESVAARPPLPEREIFQVSGHVKWFDVGRGYGFIIPDNGAQDVLLHLSVLKRDGYSVPLEGTRMVCEAVERQKGFQCLRVLSVDTSTAISPFERSSQTHVEVTPTSQWVECTVKWFNRRRGYGFVYTQDCDRDILLHMETLRQAALEAPIEGQRLYVRYGMGPKGLMAALVRPSKPLEN